MAVAPERPQHLLTASFLALVGSELAYFTAQGMLLPVVPVFVVERLGAGPATVGAVVAALSVTALVLRPWAGRASDRWGPGALLLLGPAVMAVAVAAHAAVVAVTPLVLLRVALGVAEAAYVVATVAVLAHLAPPGRRGEALSYSSLGLYLGIAVGPALGELLLRSAGFGAVWAVAALLACTAGLLAWPVRSAAGSAGRAAAEPPVPPGRGATGRRGGRTLVVPAAAFTAGVAAAAGFLAFAALHARAVGLRGAGTVLLVYGLVVIVTRVSLARHVDRGQPDRWVTVSLALAAAGLGVMAAHASEAGLYVGTVLLAVGIAVLTPAVYRLMVESAPAAAHGSVAAVFTIALDVGLGLGPLGVGLLAAGGGTVTGLAGGALVALAGAALVAVAVSSGGRRPAGAPGTPPPG